MVWLPEPQLPHIGMIVGSLRRGIIFYWRATSVVPPTLDKQAMLGIEGLE